MMNLQNKLLYELGEEYIREKGRLWLNVISPSMEPLIQIGDRLLVRHVKPEEISLGDVIIFKGNKNLFITHRVICKRRRNGELRFLEKGDRNEIATWIHKDSIIGKVKAIKRNDRIIGRLDNNKRIMFVSRLFALYQLSDYVFEKRINSFKDWAKGYKSLTLLREPYRYSYKVIKMGRTLGKKLLNPMFVKGMKLFA